MQWVWGLGLLVGWMGAACVGPLAAAPAYDILLGRPTDRSVTVSVMALAEALEAWVEYGVEPGAMDRQTPVRPLPVRFPVNYELDGLEKDRVYSYRLRWRPAGLGPFGEGTVSAFHTQRSRGSTFTFAIEADPHYQDNTPEVWGQTLTNVLADGPDFLIDLGDTFMGEKRAGADPSALSEVGIADACAAVRSQFFSIIGGTIPLYLVGGNHDPELGWLINRTLPGSNPAVWGAGAREHYFPCPVGGGFYSGAVTNDVFQGRPRDGYYSFEWGDALFVMLDPFWFTSQGGKKSKDPWSWTLGGEQYFWLKRVLEQSQAAFKFVFAHHLVGGSFDSLARGGVEYAPYFEWGGRNADGTPGFLEHRPGWPMPIQDLLLTNHVQVFFHGHDHLYAKQDYRISAVSPGEPDLVYQEVPQPSHFPYDATAYATGTNIGYNYQSGVLLGSSGHLRVTVSPATGAVEYVRSFRSADRGVTNRSVAHRYRLSSRATSLPVAGPSLQVEVRWDPALRVDLTIRGDGAGTYTVQGSADLRTWIDLRRFDSIKPPLTWTDPNPASGQMFYRVVWIP